MIMKKYKLEKIGTREYYGVPYFKTLMILIFINIVLVSLIFMSVQL